MDISTSWKRRQAPRATTSWLGLGAMALLAAGALTANARAMAESGGKPYRVEDYRLDGPGTLYVRTSGGHIDVTGTDGDAVRVEMYVTKHGRNMTPDDVDLDDYDIDFHQDGNHITATAKHQRSWLPRWSDLSISFVVHTPRAMATDLRTSGGAIEVSGLRGDQSVGTSGGDLELTGLSGKVDAHTSGGHIHIADFKGRMDSSTSGGHIEVDDADGDLTLRTSGGSIDLKALSGAVDARTSGGGIEADLLRLDGDVRLATSGGSIRVRVPENLALNVDLHGSRVSTDLPNFSGETDRHEVHGRINGGGHNLSAQTSGGSVRVTFTSP